jgi:hypothetical protein
MVIVFLYACKKAAGVGGKNEINGSVMYYNPVTASNNPAPKATIYVTYGSNTSTSQYNQAILTNDNGKFTGVSPKIIQIFHKTMIMSEINHL